MSGGGCKLLKNRRRVLVIGSRADVHVSGINIDWLDRRIFLHVDESGALRDSLNN